MVSFLLGHYVNIFIFAVMLNAKASEQSARMMSMKNATDSAEDLLNDLTTPVQHAAAGQHHEGTARDRRRPGGVGGRRRAIRIQV